MSLLLTTRTFAENLCTGICTSENTGLPRIGAGQSQVNTILQLVFAIIGAVALIFVIIGAIQFVTSQGNPQSASRARDTIIYAMVGLIIAVAAEVIVTFILGRV